LSKGGIALASPRNSSLYSLGGSMELITVWLQFAVACLADSQHLPLPWGPGTPSNTICHWTPQVYVPSGI